MRFVIKNKIAMIEIKTEFQYKIIYNYLFNVSMTEEYQFAKKLVYIYNVLSF